MSGDYGRRSNDPGSSRTAGNARQPMSPGKSTLTMGLPVQQKSGLTSQAVPIPGASAGAEVEGRELPSDGSGQPMAPELQSKMEASFGTDLSAVRIHEGSSASALGALAYTQGTDVHFAQGQYQPESEAGQALLGHELAHVVQQRQGRVQATAQAKGVDINDDTGLEAEADAMGARAARGEPAAAGGGAVTGTSGRAPIQAVWDPTSRFKDGSTLQWHKLENQLQWFYNEADDKYFFIVDGKIPNVNPVYDGTHDKSYYDTIHDESFVQKTWLEWQAFVVKPPRQFRPQDDRRLSPEQRYEAVKKDPNFVAPNPTANPRDIADTLDLGLSKGVQAKFEAVAARVDPDAQAKQSLADKDVYGRIPPVFNRVKAGLNQGKLEPTPDLIKKINETLALNRYELSAINSFEPATAARLLKSASEALSEVQYAAIVLGTNTVQGGYVLGAQGPVWNPDQIEAPSPEVKHGGLPPLDVLRLEVDGYYQSSDGVLHADEVKDTPRAMAEKVKKGDQLARQVEWLKKPAINKTTGLAYKKQVSYYVQAPGPGFDNLLDQAVINNLALIEQNHQEPNPELVLVHTQSFTLKELDTMMKRALKWLTDSKKVLDKKGIKLGVAAQRYFGDLQTANKSLKDGPLAEE